VAAASGYIRTIATGTFLGLPDGEISPDEYMG